MDVLALEGAGVGFVDAAPQIDVNISPEVQRISRQIGFALLAVWAVYLLMRVALPSNRFGGGRAVGPFKIIMFLILVLLLMDLEKFVAALNGGLSLLYTLWDWVRSISISS